MTDKIHTSRRKFLANMTKSFGACTCAAISGSLLSSCETFNDINSPSQGITETIDITSPTVIPDETDRIILSGEYGYGGGTRIGFEYANYSIPVILVRLSADEIACFSTLCTHDNCYGENMNPPSRDFPFIVCNCHLSQFDPFQNGKAIKGPAEKPLKQFKTRFNKETNILAIDF